MVVKKWFKYFKLEEDEMIILPNNSYSEYFKVFYEGKELKNIAGIIININEEL